MCAGIVYNLWVVIRDVLTDITTKTARTRTKRNKNVQKTNKQKTNKKTVVKIDRLPTLLSPL